MTAFTLLNIDVGIAATNPLSAPITIKSITLLEGGDRQVSNLFVSNTDDSAYIKVVTEKAVFLLGAKTPVIYIDGTALPTTFKPYENRIFYAKVPKSYSEKNNIEKADSTITIAWPNGSYFESNP